MKMTRAFVRGTAGLALLLAAVWFLGPRVDTALHPRSLALPADLDRFLADSEAGIPDLVPGAEKTIVWASPAKTRTPLALVYLHGFSATRRETAPLCDQLARQFGANLYYARLTGHGRHGDALAQATVSDWLNDALEAMAIARRLGDRVVVIATSTGGTLATWLALQPTHAPEACVLISPNFCPKDHRALVLTWPWAHRFAPALLGAERHRTPRSAPEAMFWTTHYPTTALIPMMGLVTLVRDADVTQLRPPVLVIYAPDDEVVDGRETEETFARIGSPQKQLHAFRDSAQPRRHVLAGDIMAPENTELIATAIHGFITAQFPELAATPARTAPAPGGPH